MNKKLGVGLLIGIIAIGGFVGIYYFTPLLRPEGADPSSGILALILSGFFIKAPAQRWAFIICSSHVFYEEEHDYDQNKEFDGGEPPWEKEEKNSSFCQYDKKDGYHDAGFNPGCLNISSVTSTSYGKWHISNDSVKPGINYTLSVWVKKEGKGNTTIGIEWTDFGAMNKHVYQQIGNTSFTWIKVHFHTYCPMWATGFNITLDQKGTGWSKFDSVHLYELETVLNNTGVQPVKASDGFPAQAIQSYWALRNHSYNASNIFLMMNAGDTDVRVWTPAKNDYTYTAPFINVSGTDVNKTRFMKELNASIPGSFASRIKPQDQLLVYMVDHGSNQNNDGNASFHFDTGGNVTEHEVGELLDTITCSLIIFMADMCFAGNFISPILSSAPNRILIASSAPPFLSWYWINANQFHYAGSFFFHPFWDSLNITGNALINATNAGCSHIPFGHVQDVATIQAPIYIDNTGGVIFTWTL